MTEVERETAEVQDFRWHTDRAPQDRPQSRQQFLNGKRLGKTIVGADVQPGHAIDEIPAGRQHNHRDAAAVDAQFLNERSAVDG